jgi:hypothetical protein
MFTNFALVNARLHIVNHAPTFNIQQIACAYEMHVDL